MNRALSTFAVARALTRRAATSILGTGRSTETVLAGGTRREDGAWAAARAARGTGPKESTFASAIPHAVSTSRGVVSADVSARTSLPPRVPGASATFEPLERTALAASSFPVNHSAWEARRPDRRDAA